MKKRACLSLGAGLALSCAAAVPGQAQEFAGPTAVSTVAAIPEPAAPLMFVYITKPDDNVLPRIALGVEKPALKITALEKCVRVTVANPKLAGIAAQLKADDTRTLVAAIKALGAPDARELPNVVIWFTASDNKALDYINTSGSNIEANLVKGVLMFDFDGEEPMVRYLNEKLHPE